jgi:hypothetical protein
MRLSIRRWRLILNFAAILDPWFFSDWNVLLRNEVRCLMTRFKLCDTSRAVVLGLRSGNNMFALSKPRYFFSEIVV